MPQGRQLEVSRATSAHTGLTHGPLCLPAHAGAPWRDYTPRHSRALVELVDLFPTVVELAGVEPLGVPHWTSGGSGGVADGGDGGGSDSSDSSSSSLSEPQLDGVSLASLFTPSSSQPCDDAANLECVKEVAYSQFARQRCFASPWSHRAPDGSVCTGVSGTDSGDSADYYAQYMGYSARTATHRYTLWVKVDADLEASDSFPDWSTTVAEEL